jgi:hypothetical protein
VVDGSRARLAKWWQPEVRDELKELMLELGERGRLFPQAWRGPVPRSEQLRRLRDAIAPACGEIDAILAEQPARPATDGAAAGPGERT